MDNTLYYATFEESDSFDEDNVKFEENKLIIPESIIHQAKTQGSYYFSRLWVKEQLLNILQKTNKAYAVIVDYKGRIFTHKRKDENKMYQKILGKPMFVMNDKVWMKLKN